jgi:hypothetical protein
VIRGRGAGFIGDSVYTVELLMRSFFQKYSFQSGAPECMTVATSKPWNTEKLVRHSSTTTSEIVWLSAGLLGLSYCSINEQRHAPSLNYGYGCSPVYLFLSASDLPFLVPASYYINLLTSNPKQSTLVHRATGSKTSYPVAAHFFSIEKSRARLGQ